MVTTHDSARSGLAWWYAAPAIFGGVQLIALPLLIPAYTLELTGSPAQSGGVLSMIGAAGFVAPLIGRLADARNWHGPMQLAAILGYLVGFALLAFVPWIGAVYLATALIGTSSIALLSINPTFIVAAGYGPQEQALRLTRMNQSIFVGAIVMGLLLAVLSGLGKQAGFIAVMFVAALAWVVTRIDNSAAALRMQSAQVESTDEGGAGEKGKLSFGFIIFLLAVFTGMMASSNQVAQGPNVLETIFAVDPALISGMLTLSAIVSLLTLNLGGRLMEKADAGAIWLVGLGIYAITSGGMALLVGVGASSGWIALLFQLLFMQGLSLVDMAKPALAERATSLSPSTTQGVLLFAIAGGYSVGALSGGQLAEVTSLGLIPAFAGGMALLSLFFAVWSLRCQRS